MRIRISFKILFITILHLNSYSQYSKNGVLDQNQISPTFISKENIFNFSANNINRLRTELNNNSNSSNKLEFKNSNHINQIIVSSYLKDIKSGIGVIVKHDNKSENNYLNYSGIIYNYNYSFTEKYSLNIGSQIGYLKNRQYKNIVNLESYDTIIQNVNLKLTTSLEIDKLELGLLWSKIKNQEWNYYYNDFNLFRIYCKYSIGIGELTKIKPLIYYDFLENNNEFNFGIDYEYNEKIYSGLLINRFEYYSMYLGLKIYNDLKIYIGRELIHPFSDYREIILKLRYDIN